MNDKQKEILLIAQEECAEVTQAISKIFRFGMDSKHPDRSETNKQHLEDEVGDLQAMIQLMVDHGILNKSHIEGAASRKYDKLMKWSNILA